MSKKNKLKKTKWALSEPYFIDKKDKRYKKYKKYLKITGISPDETWSLTAVIADFVLPRLKLYKKICGAPGGMPEKDWNKILGELPTG